MNKEEAELVKIMINKSDQAMTDAKLLLDNDSYFSAVNRIYYSCFYLITALLASRNLFVKTHTGTKTLFNLHFIKSNILPYSFSDFYAFLFDKRLEGDYGGFETFSGDEISSIYSEALQFNNDIKQLIQANS